MFSNFTARRRLEEKWKKLRKEYAAAGMSPMAIEAMYQYDLEMYRSDRRFYEHVLMDSFQESECDVDLTADIAELRKKFLEAITVMPQETDKSRRYSWFDELDSSRLVEGVQHLSPQDLDLLDLYVIEDYSVGELAAMQGVSQPTISKKLKRIINSLKKF